MATYREVVDVASLQCRLETGRTHQIRAHLAATGRPILGDTLYGGPTTIDGTTVPRLMLHAARLALPHPVTQAPLVLDAPLPRDFAALAALDVELGGAPVLDDGACSAAEHVEHRSPQRAAQNSGRAWIETLAPLP